MATHLRMVQFDGTTFGMDVQNAVAFRALKKNISYGEITPRGWHHSTKRRIIPAKYVAAVMGEAAWLITENRCMETVRWEDSGELYIVYETGEADQWMHTR